MGLSSFQDGQSRTVRQFQFTDWPEQGVPKSGEGFIDFIGQVHKTKEQFGQDGPISVHCRAGGDGTGSSPASTHLSSEMGLSSFQDGQSRTVRQFQFTDWPEQGVPKSGEGFIDFIGQVHKTKEQFGQDGPISVHCSAGVGRTGVFITLSIVLERMRYEGVVDIFQTVKMLRTQRPAMVQTEVRQGRGGAPAGSSVSQASVSSSVRWARCEWAALNASRFGLEGASQVSTQKSRAKECPLEWTQRGPL
ncbi:Receptor-type tyrosine-protein phosphatase delta [Myotis davidii]|uniref:protein-tyrosine-phosphatase n=1 Tax=Myotis davidii TaxID=225400 RepID=L5MI58_MYODS|nr:Receptor-type tyrosine-protein phosphatase delta [Myotis davidii]